jgi:TPR repeat protein
MAFTDFEVRQTREAAHRNGGADDLYRMGLIYSTDQQGSVDLVQAHMWFNLAAMQGSQTAKESRRDLAGQMSSREIATAQRNAREWVSQYRKH